MVKKTIFLLNSAIILMIIILYACITVTIFVLEQPEYMVGTKVTIKFQYNLK